MSVERTFSTISDYVKSSNGVVALPIRPNQGSQYGSPGLSGKELQAKFDLLASIIIDKYNVMATALSSDEALEYLKLPEGYSAHATDTDTATSNLSALIKCIVDAQGYLLAIDPETDEAERLNDVLDSLYSMIAEEAVTRKEKDDIEAKARASADRTLQLNIITEESERTEADATEKSEREATDTALLQLIKQEGKTRENADHSLASSIANEIVAREVADADLTQKYTDVNKSVTNLSGNLTALSGSLNTLTGSFTTLSADFSSLKGIVDYFFSTISDGSNDPIDRLAEIVYFLEENRDIIEVLRNDKIDKTSIVTTEDAFEMATDNEVPSAKFIREHFKNLGTDVDFVTGGDLDRVLENYLTTNIAERDYVNKLYLKDTLDDYVTDDTLKETLLNYATKENLLKYASKENIAQSLKYIITSYSSTTEGIEAWLGKNEYWNVASISGISVGDNVVFRCDNTTTNRFSYVFASVTAVEAATANNRIRAISESVIHENAHDYEVRNLLNEIYDTNGTLGLVYDVYDDLAVLRDTGEYTDEEEIEIASMVMGVPVTKIESRSFNCKNAHTVIIPPSIRLIDVSAFKGADSLQNILYAGSIDGWNEISKYSTGNDALTNATVHSVGMVTPNAAMVAGAKCDNTELKIPEYFRGVPVRIVGDDEYIPPALEGGKFILPASVTHVHIPDTVMKLSVAAFSFYENLRSIRLSNNIKAIPAGAFWYTGLLEIVLPRGVESIGDNAFYLCSSLQTVFIPKSVTTIGEVAFALCSSLSTIRYEGTKEEWDSITKSSDWLYGSNPTILYEQGG